MDRFERTCWIQWTFYTQNMHHGFASIPSWIQISYLSQKSRHFEAFYASKNNMCNCSHWVSSVIWNRAGIAPVGKRIHVNCPVELWCNERRLRRSSHFHPHAYGPLRVSPAGQCWNDLCSEREVMNQWGVHHPDVCSLSTASLATPPNAAVMARNTLTKTYHIDFTIKNVWHIRTIDFSGFGN